MDGERGVVHLNASPRDPRIVTLLVKRDSDETPELALIQHNLDNSYPIVQLWDQQTGLMVETVTQTIDCNTIAMKFMQPIINGRFVCTVFG